MLYTRLDKKVYLVIEKGLNLKVTTPEDFYYLKSILELEKINIYLVIGDYMNINNDIKEIINQNIN